MGILIIFIYINIKIIYSNIILRYLPLANSQIYVAWMDIGKSGNRQYICIYVYYLPLFVPRTDIIIQQIMRHKEHLSDF